MRLIYSVVGFLVRDALLLAISQGDACACDAWNDPGIGTAPIGGGWMYSGRRSDQPSFLTLPVLRAYQRLVTSLVIAIPRSDWSSFGWLRRTRGWSGRFQELPGHSLSIVRTAGML